MAVSPPHPVEDTFRETPTLTATDTQNVDNHAAAVSFALAPGHQLDENGVRTFTLWIPFVAKPTP